jgi:hypothetical protein
VDRAVFGECKVEPPGPGPGKKINLRKIHRFFFKNTYFNPFHAEFCRDMLGETSGPFWVPEKIDNGHFDQED